MNKLNFERSNQSSDVEIFHNNHSQQMEKRKKLKVNLITCNYIAIIILFTFTPLGFIHLGFVKLTLLHIPVILASLILGKRRGALVGFCFALLSLIINTMSPSLMSFAFSPIIPVYGSSHGSIFALVVCFVPRIILGYFPGVIVEIIEARLRRNHSDSSLTFSNHYKKKNQLIIYALLAFFSTLLHTALVATMLIVFFLPAISALREITITEGIFAILFLCFNNGIAEAILALIVVPSLTIPLKSFTNKILARK